MLRSEFDVVFKYLCGTKATDETFQTFCRIEDAHAVAFSENEMALWLKMTKSTWTMRSVDAYLALHDPYNNVRQKLYLALALAETRPELAHLFLPRKFSISDYFSLMGQGFRAVVACINGFFIVKPTMGKCK